MSQKKFSATIENYGFKPGLNINPQNDKAIIKQAHENTFEDKDGYYKDKVINLDELSLADLTRQLSDSLGKKQPIFLWSKNREINKIRLDSDRQRMLKDRIETLREMGESLQLLRADAIVSEKMIVLLSEMKKSKAKAELKRIVASSKSESSFYERKVKEDELFGEKFEIENELLRADGETEIDLKKSKIEMYKLFFEKLKDNSIKEIPVDVLHEIANFYNEESEDNIETIAQYNKVLSDIDKNKAESFRTYAEGKTKLADSESREIDNQAKLYNFRFNQKSNA
ncbi:MAG: hypothetical protein HZB41_10115 [Ignavibacteriae bacterium]|nr:hypothetical protein [Ignavibacteriota bacterium]